MYKKFFTLVSFLLVIGFGLHATGNNPLSNVGKVATPPVSITFVAGSAYVCPLTATSFPTTIDIPIKVAGFNSISDYTGSVSWDTSVLKFDTLINLETNFTLGAFNYDQKKIPGSITMSWTPLDYITPVTLPDSTIIFTIRFYVKTNFGSSSLIQFTETPTPFNGDYSPDGGATFIPLTFVKKSGLVTLSPNTPISAATATSFCVGGSVVLSTTAIGTYQWYNGGGIIAGTTTNNYTESNSNKDSVVVHTAQGCFVPSSAITVTKFPRSVPAYSINTATQCVNGNSFIFTNTTTIGSGTMTYNWNFGDGNTSTLTSPSHTYASAGTYTVKLLVTSNNGCVDSISKTVTVNPKPTPSYTINTVSQCLNGNSYIFTNSSTVSVGTLTYNWSFGDGNISTATNPTNIYAASGSYTVKLVVTSDNGCKDSVSQTVTVNPSPVSSFTIVNASQCLHTNNYDFTNTSTISSGTMTYNWNLGQGAPTTVTSPSIIYSGIGIFDVKLTSTSDKGCIDSITQQVYVDTQFNVKATITTNNLYNCYGQSITYTAKGMFGGSTPSYQWYKNNIKVGTDTTVYTDNAPLTGDQVYCIFTSSLACVLTPSANSDTLTITVAPPPTTINVTLINCDSVVLHNISYYNNTVITDTIKNINNCDSIYVINNITVNLIPKTINNINLSSCNQFTYKGITYTSSTIVRDTVISAQGCDSIYNVATITITPIVAITNNMTYTGCSNVVYKGVTYTSSTIVRDTSRSVQGCDSVYNVATITITPIVALTNNLTYTGCSNVVYKGITYTSSTIVRDTVISAQGCDSVYNVATITITPIVVVINKMTYTGCSNVVYKGITYTSSTIVRDTVISSQGCDSVYNVATITITPLVAITNNMNFNGCSNVIYKGITYTTSTIVRDTVISVQGCDSVYNVAIITITPIVTLTNNLTYTGCSNVIYKGITYTSSTIVRDTVISAQGCDSVYNVATITITPIIAVTNNTSQSGCSSVIYNGVTYNSSTVITDTVKSVNSCDSVYNVVTITVTTPITPSVSLNSTSVVANSSPVTFTATATNGGNATIYIFTVNSTVVQTGASNTYTSSTLNVSDTVVCSIISNATCITTTTAVSSQIIMTTNVPLTLLSFHAALAGINADCSWQTTAEVNTDYFIVQRSVDGNSFINISTINATGNASTISNYSYSDANVTDIKNVSVLYYRLQMVDKNGHFTYSKIVKVDLSASIEFSLYPNPVKSNLNVQINYTKSIKGLAQITDLQGKVLQQQSIQLNAGNNTISLNTANLTTGNYILSIKTEDGTLLKQFMKQ